ncbi:uncharacterized protein GLRG_04743 [Colletotrichum graminicola M1.001]|uniref:Uncharacterized protein n=1 Tax=Colletotrichum graminicola (strain M1.001 / M2 / FGSC 10212) TaxID=645133 RepID=E3QFG1_COLGM|nr:uncharacterized protein GLRG_04743 [Colletotrichum graminicola M1.001]EFQ29599.1 hypothetical protein GLRG_04743 [Colletotrichum graminicola M1.001]
MASYNPGDRGPFQGHDFPVGNVDHDTQGANPDPLTTNPRHLPPSHTYHYPSGIRNYNLVPAKEGETPRRYVEAYLSISFYSHKEIKAVFSTNNGEVPTRGVSLNHVHDTRELDLWNAEELQDRANAIRKKHWKSLGSLARPQRWEDLCDYFDCFEIYFQGALNLWNLMHLLFDENDSLSRNKACAAAVELGVWCDEWVAQAENKAKLMGFNCWEGDVVGLITPGTWAELQKLPVDITLLRNALCHRQNQLLGKPWARPTAYPANSLGANWHNGTLQCWLAGQSVHDTPSGIPLAVSPSTIIVGGAASSVPKSHVATVPTHMTANTNTTLQKPLIVSGTSNRQKVRTQNYDLTAGQGNIGRSRESLSDNQLVSSTSGPSTGNPATGAPESHPAKTGAAQPGFYHQSMRPYGRAFNTPFMTGPNGEPKPYHGPVGPSAPPPPPALPTLGHQHYGHRPPVNIPPRRSEDSRVTSSVHTSPVQISMVPTGGTRMPSAVYQRVPFDVTPSRKHDGKRNATVSSAADQGSGQGLPMGPPRFSPNQDTRQEQMKIPNAPGNASYDHSRPRRESKGWEKVPHTDHSIHGPVFRRSPTKENRSRSFSNKAEFHCSNLHPKSAHKHIYTPCTCPRCEERERSVYVQLNPAPQISQKILVGKMHEIMSRWGEVDNVQRLPVNENPGDFVCFFVRFKDGSRVREASATDVFSSRDLDCTIKIGAMHHSSYGNAMYSNYGPDNSQHDSASRSNSQQQSSWRGNSNAFGQFSSSRPDPRTLVSLEQYMVPRSQPVQAPAAHPPQPSSFHDPATPLATNARQEAKKDTHGPVEDIKLTCNTPKLRTKPAVTVKLRTSAEAESQSKPPSEEVIPDEEQTSKTSPPLDPENSPSKGGSKAIVVNLPATPQKPKEADTNTQTPRRATTPQNGGGIVTPTKHISPAAPGATDHEESSSDGQRESQTAVKTVPEATILIKKSNPVSVASVAPAVPRVPVVPAVPLVPAVPAAPAVPAVPAQPQAERTSHDRGKYRKIFSEKNDLNVEVCNAPETKIGKRCDQSPIVGFSPKEHSSEQEDDSRTQAGHVLDNLIDSSRTQEDVPTVAASEIATKKKSSKKSKKKKKPTSMNQGESSSAQQPAKDTPILVTEEQAPEVSMTITTEMVEDTEPEVLREVIAKAKQVIGVKEVESISAKRLAKKATAGTVSQTLASPVDGTAQSKEPGTSETAEGKGILRPEGYEPKEPPEKSELSESIKKTFRADGGGSLRLPKNRKKQLPAQLIIASRDSFASESAEGTRSFEAPQTFNTGGLPSAASTARFSSSAQETGSPDGSSGRMSTPATPPSATGVSDARKTLPDESAAGAETTPKSNTSLNPQAKVFVSPTTSSTAAAPKKIDLAPVPLRPTKHDRSVSQTSSKTSRTLTIGTPSTKEEDSQSDGSAAETSKGKEKSSASQQTPVKNVAEKNKGRSLASDKMPATQMTLEEDNDDWQVQGPKRDFGIKQLKGNNDHQQQQGKQSPKKNRPSPKKQKIQEDSHLQQQRYASSSNTNPVPVGSKTEFPTLPPAPKPVSGLPASSVWGKARSASAATTVSTPSGSVKTSANPSPKKDSGKQ